MRMARGASSRASRRVTRVPFASLSVWICSCETSSVMGMGKREPSTRRRVETTLRTHGFDRSALSRRSGESSALVSSPLVVLLAHEALERRETSVQDEFEVAELPLGQTNVGELLRLLN